MECHRAVPVTGVKVMLCWIETREAVVVHIEMNAGV